MTLKKVVFILSALFFTVFSAFSQDGNDSLRLYPDSIVNLRTNNVILNQKIDTVKVEDILEPGKLKADPTKVLWMSAILPGSGQILNKRYWKLPFVYGGFMGFAYAISWNNSRYNSYKLAYRDIIDSDPNTNSFLDILPKGYEYVPTGGTLKDKSKIAVSQEQYTRRLKTSQDAFRRYRDLSVILSVGFYALVILDAYVDAHLADFDISPDLTLNIQPTKIQNVFDKRGAYGLQCSLRF